MLSEKYIAGFIDADGHIGIQWKKGRYKPLLVVGFSQKTCHDKVLRLIQDAIGGSLTISTIKGHEYSRLGLTGRSAQKALNRIKKHLVLKRHYAEFCIDLVSRGIPRDLDQAKFQMKGQRKVPCLPIPNFPPRKWIAGYFDGDGCVRVGVRKKTGVATITASIGAANWDLEGIQTLHKNFGGSICQSRNSNVTNWQLNVPPSKAKHFLGYFNKYSIVKKAQIDFILGCAQMGHYRDGKSIRAVMKQLKAQEHRLSESTLAELLAGITDKAWGRHGKGHECCRGCSKTDERHYSKGYCRPCYMTRYRANGEKAFDAIVGPA